MGHSKETVSLTSLETLHLWRPFPPGRVVRRPCGGPPRHRQRVHGHRQRVRQQRRGRGGGDASAGSGRGAAAAAVGPEAALKVTAPWTLPLYLGKL